MECRLEARRPDGYGGPVDDTSPWIPCDDPERFGLPFSSAILALKCTTAVPLWMSTITQRFSLQPFGFSKYAGAVDTIGGFPRRVGPLREPSHWLGRGTWISLTSSPPDWRPYASRR